MSTSLVPVPDEQPDTLPEGLPLGDIAEIFDIISALSDEERGGDDIVGENPDEDVFGRLPTRKPFDEEPTRKKHAPKAPKAPDDELTNVSDLHDLFKNWSS